MEKITEAMENKDCCFVHDSKERSAEEIKDLVCRLNRIEGQIRGIKGMVERGAYCPEILTQVSGHIRGCVAGDIRDGNDAAIDELVNVLQKLMK